MSSNAVKKKFYIEVNVMRGFLALLVVLGHITIQIELNGSRIKNKCCKLSYFTYSKINSTWV